MAKRTRKKIVRIKATGDVVQALSGVVEEGLKLSILNASVSPDTVAAEIAVQAADDEHIRNFLRTLREFGIEVEEIEKTLVHDGDECLHCTACHSVCPTGAIELKGIEIELDDEECIVCGSCTEMCPSGALRVVQKGGERGRR
ncbi:MULTISPECIES: 4Fe-4S dicluster domain-containing protein [unclassified Methanopyrus]|uniref:4Fe-4S dicluster domain-containing protein n=1 Tax=unclassified Methanopyrus TaxID=2684913 RepID=UPI000B4B1F73|nr:MULTISPECIES: 4Fe-4S binding protein [unclassified Methanopyrus]